MAGRVEAAVGTPWVALGDSLSGFDCWGFVRYALALTDAPKAPFFDERTRSSQIVEILPAFRRVPPKTPNSILLMGTRGNWHHVGVYLEGGMVYHCLEGMGVCGHRHRALGILGFDSFDFYTWGQNAKDNAQD